MNKRYIITKPAFKGHYNVASEDGDTVYFVDIKTKIKPSKPRFTFHSGKDTQAPIFAVLHFQPPTVDMKVGLGDINDVAAVEWEDLSCLNKATHAKYSWSVDLPAEDAANGEVESRRRRTFTWTRTRSHGVDGTKPTGATNRHWKLAEEGNEELLAIFTGDAKIGKCGTLAVCDSMGPKFEGMVLVTLMGLYERARSAGGG